MRALCYLNGASIDRARLGDEYARERVELFTPITKGWCTDLGVEVTSIGVQIHGGMGYVEETGAAQFWRDSRIAPIYEGTNGIQAIDLVTRKLSLRGGAVVAELLAEMRSTAAAADGDLVDVGLALLDAVAAFERGAQWLGDRLRSGDVNDVLTGATPFLRLAGTVVGGWLLVKSALAARTDSAEAMTDKAQSARFYAAHALPLAAALVPAVSAGYQSLA